MSNSASPVHSSRLFNCCTDHVPPNWSQFERLELAGCRADDDGECTLGLQSAADARFFTVYGRFPAPDGTCEAITDIADPRDAIAVAAELALLSRLPVIVHPTLATEGRGR